MLILLLLCVLSTMLSVQSADLRCRICDTPQEDQETWGLHHCKDGSPKYQGKEYACPDDQDDYCVLSIFDDNFDHGKPVQYSRFCANELNVAGWETTAISSPDTLVYKSETLCTAEEMTKKRLEMI